MPHLERHVFICTNRRKDDDPKGSCAAKGGDALKDALKAAVHARGLKGRVRANAAGCLDACAQGCAIVVYPEQAWYGKVTLDDVDEIVDKHLVGGTIVERLLLPNQPHLDGKKKG